MKCLLLIVCIVCSAYGDTLTLSTVPGMELMKTSLNESSDVVNYFLELLGVTVNPVSSSVVVEDPFRYASILVIVEDSECAFPTLAVSHKTKEAIDWKQLKNSLKATLNKRLSSRASFYESPRKVKKGEEIRTIEMDVQSQQKELEQIKDEISSGRVSKTVVWIKTDKSDKQYCDMVQDFMTAVKEETQQVLIALVSKEAVLLREKRFSENEDHPHKPYPFDTENHPDIWPAEKPKKQVKPPKLPTTVPRPKFTSKDYPAIFMMIAFVVLLFVISLIAISYGIAGMDPGRDSIIYRMTSQRMKKDQ